jgi:hypothetical protein
MFKCLIPFWYKDGGICLDLDVWHEGISVRQESREHSNGYVRYFAEGKIGSFPMGTWHCLLSLLVIES